MHLSLFVRRFLFVAAVVVTSQTPAAADFDFAGLSDPMYRLPDRAFPECCAEPAWWSSEENRPIGSIEELYAVWQNRDVPDRRKAETFFQAIRDFRGRNDEIEATAIALYPNVDRKYPDLVPLLEYGVGKFFDYDGSQDHYVGPPADRSAGLVRHLARQYQKKNLHEQTVKLLAAFMVTRERETNPHLNQLISMQLAQSLDALGQTRMAERLLAHAGTYDGSWGERIAEQRGKLREKLPLLDRLPEYTVHLLLGGIVLLAAGAAFFARRRQVYF